MACCWSVNFTVSFILGLRCATVIPFAPYGSAIIAWTQKTLHPLACFGQAWLLTEHMSNAEELKKQIEQGVEDLTKLLTAEKRILSQEAFDLLYGLIELTIRIVEVSTKNEYAVASKKLESIGAVDFLDNFLVDMAKVKLLEVTN